MEKLRDRRSRLHRSALRWALGAAGFAGAIVVGLFIAGAYASISKTGVWLALLAMLGLVICALLALVRMIEPFIPYRPAQPSSIDRATDISVVMEHGRGRRWANWFVVCFLGSGISIIAAVLIPPLFTVLISIGLFLFAGGIICFFGVVVQDAKAASTIARLDRENALRHGAAIAEQISIRHRWAPLHWWEWLGEFVFLMGVMVGAPIFIESGIRGGWLPLSPSVASGIIPSLAAVFVVVALFVWALFRTPWHKRQRPYLILVTLLAAALTAPVGVIGSLEHWKLFVSEYSGRSAGLILGVVYMIIWLTGYQLTKRFNRPPAG